METDSNMDNLLKQENHELHSRVGDLEKKVLDQNDEIACLKSAVSDCVRRLQILESTKGSAPATPRMNTPNTPRKPINMSSGAGASAMSRVKHGSARSNMSNGHNDNSSSGIRHHRSSARSNKSADHGMVKESVFLKDEGVLRMYLHGRALNLYLPTGVDSLDMKTPTEQPDETLKMEWVYGYRGRDCRNNVHFLPTGEMIYFVAGVIILYNVEEQMQRHYIEHTDDVKCLAIHPDRITVASGQVAGRDKEKARPHVRIWNSVNLTTLHVIGMGDFDRSVTCLGFSKVDGGNLLCAIDEANEHNLTVWDWANENKLSETKSSTDPVLAVEFHPLDKGSIVSCGKNHLAFWTLDGKQLSKKLGIYEKFDKPKFTLCMTFVENGDLVTGDSSGNIMVWKRGTTKVLQSIQGAHDGPVFALCVTRDGQLVSGGGKDRRIVLWDAAFGQTGQEVCLDECNGPVRTIVQGPGGILFAGTTWNFIMQGNLSLGFSPIVNGGHTDEIWTLVCRPNGQSQFLSGSYDKHVSLWDALTHGLVWSKELPDSPHCANFHPDSQLVAIGTCIGRWYVLDIMSREIVTVHTDGNEQIECVGYSPEGTMIALGSRDNCIYVYNCIDGGRKYIRLGKCCGHSSFITHLDWSKDGQYIRSTSGDYELLYWSAHNCRQVASSTLMRDVIWDSQNCVIGCEVAGIWGEGYDGTDINAVARSTNERLLATADDFGRVKLFRYPCMTPKGKSHSYGGHSSHVTGVSFLKDDSRLLSCGGKDLAIIQWEIL